MYVTGGLGIMEASCIPGTWAVNQAAGTELGATLLGKAQGW